MFAQLRKRRLAGKLKSTQFPIWRFAALTMLVLFALSTVMAQVVLGARPPDAPTQSVAVVAQQPNIVVVLADDLDMQLDTLKYTPAIHSLLTEQGMTFSQFFCQCFAVLPLAFVAAAGAICA